MARLGAEGNRLAWVAVEVSGGGVARNLAGAIHTAPAFVSVAPPDAAWMGIQDLHRRATGSGANLFAATAGLSPDQAFGAYSSAVTSVLGQLSVLDPAASDHLLGSLADHVWRHGLDGLESVFLSAFEGALPAGPTDALLSAMSWWTEFGPSHVLDGLGGGADTALVLDPPTGRLSLADAAQLADAFAGSDHTITSMADRLERLHDRVASGGQRHAEHAGPATDAIRQAGFLTATGATLGTVFLGGPLGGLAGAGAGFALKHGPAALVEAGEHVLDRIGEFGKGVIHFFEGIFGGHGDAHPDRGAAGTTEQRPRPATEAARGQKVVVDTSEVVTTERTTQKINPDGSVETTHETVRRETHTTQTRTVLHPDDPAKCGTGESGGVEPGWEESWPGFHKERRPFDSYAQLSPGLMPFGQGLDVYDVHLDGDLLKLESLPSLNEAGAVEAVGFLEQQWPTVKDLPELYEPLISEPVLDGLVERFNHALRSFGVEITPSVEQRTRGILKAVITVNQSRSNRAWWNRARISSRADTTETDIVIAALTEHLRTGGLGVGLFDPVGPEGF